MPTVKQCSAVLDTNTKRTFCLQQFCGPRPICRRLNGLLQLALLALFISSCQTRPLRTDLLDRGLVGPWRNQKGHSLTIDGRGFVNLSRPDESGDDMAMQVLFLLRPSSIVEFEALSFEGAEILNAKNTEIEIKIAPSWIKKFKVDHYPSLKNRTLMIEGEEWWREECQQDCAPTYQE